MKDRALVILSPNKAIICTEDNNVRSAHLEDMTAFLMFGPKERIQKYEVVSLMGYKTVSLQGMPSELTKAISEMFDLPICKMKKIEKAEDACKWIKDMIEKHPDKFVIPDGWV